jgi:Zn-dependent protease
MEAAFHMRDAPPRDLERGRSMLLMHASPGEILALLTTLIVGLTVHEYAHAWSAYRLGDPTAREAGRMTLDPRKHIDPLGALMLLVAGFGWAKPVPIDPYRLGRRGTLLVALAGPLSNVALAAAAALGLRLMVAAVAPVMPQLALTALTFVAGFLVYFVTLNLVLAVFNSLPVAPLDGWRVLMGVVPPDTAYRLRQIEPYSAMALFALIAFGRVGNFSIFGTIIGGPVDVLRRLLLGQ